MLNTTISHKLFHSNSIFFVALLPFSFLFFLNGYLSTAIDSETKYIWICRVDNRKTSHPIFFLHFVLQKYTYCSAVMSKQPSHHKYSQILFCMEMEGLQNSMAFLSQSIWDFLLPPNSYLYNRKFSCIFLSIKVNCALSTQVLVHLDMEMFAFINI